MTPEEIAALFTRSDGSYLCARWGRPIAPVVFGCDDATLKLVKGALTALTRMAGHPMAETDPELGANLMIFFIRDWAELPDVPNLERMIPGLGPLCARLAAEGASQYRLVRVDRKGAIRAAFQFLRVNGDMARVPADQVAVTLAVQVMLLWSETAFAEGSPLERAGRRVGLRPDIAAVIRAAYDPVMPAVARDASHALRLRARMDR